MPELKHTPGLWLFTKGSRSNGIFNRDFSGSIEAVDPDDGENWHVAAIWGNCGADKEHIANAKLIAAAPDLLEAAISIIDELSPTDFKTQQLQSAIKKATE